MPGAVFYINHYNSVDWALSFGFPGILGWQFNQMTKPDSGYHYGIPSPVPDPLKRFWKNSGFLGIAYTDLSFPTDRFEIFSYAAESHSFATGQQGATGGMFGAALNLNSPSFNFGGAHKGHSAQFRSNIQTRWSYWTRVLDDMLIAVP